MANQQKIIPMGQLYGVMIDIEGVSALADFEVIEIVDNSNPYPMILGIDLVIDMNWVINLKKRMMSFEIKSLIVIVPLDPMKGACYTKAIRDYIESDNEIDQI